MKTLFRLLMPVCVCDWCLCGLCEQTAGKPTPNGTAAWAEGALVTGLPATTVHCTQRSKERWSFGQSGKSQGAWSALVCTVQCVLHPALLHPLLCPLGKHACSLLFLPNHVKSCASCMNHSGHPTAYSRMLRFHLFGNEEGLEGRVSELLSL